MKVEEFINLKKGNKSVEEYSLKIYRMYRFGHFLVSNPKYDMSRYVTGVADLLKEECYTVMIHDELTLGKLIVYDQSIEESKLVRIARNIKRSGSSEQRQPRFKKRAQTQDGPGLPMV